MNRKSPIIGLLAIIALAPALWALKPNWKH
jgi:hypothetical protein